jgi:hypothetical protein
MDHSTTQVPSWYSLTRSNSHGKSRVSLKARLVEKRNMIAQNQAWNQGYDFVSRCQWGADSGGRAVGDRKKQQVTQSKSTFTFYAKHNLQ